MDGKYRLHQYDNGGYYHGVNKGVETVPRPFIGKNFLNGREIHSHINTGGNHAKRGCKYCKKLKFTPHRRHKRG